MSSQSSKPAIEMSSTNQTPLSTAPVTTPAVTTTQPTASVADTATVAVVPAPVVVVKPPLTKQEIEARDLRMKTAEKIERAFLGKVRGPELRARLPDMNYDINYLYTLSQEDLDLKLQSVKRVIRNLAGSEVFSTGVPMAAPLIEKVLVWAPFFRNNGYDFHGFAKQLLDNPRLNLILESADDELTEVIGVNPIVGAAVSLATAAKDAHARNGARKEAIRWYYRSKQLTGTGRVNIQIWHGEMERCGYTTAEELIEALKLEDASYQEQDKADETRAKAAVGDLSKQPGAQNAPKLPPAPTKAPLGKPAVVMPVQSLVSQKQPPAVEEHKTAESEEDSDDDD